MCVAMSACNFRNLKQQITIIFCRETKQTSHGYVRGSVGLKMPTHAHFLYTGRFWSVM